MPITKPQLGGRRSWLLAVAGCLSAGCGSGSGPDADPMLIQTVTRGDLRIAVRERGELQAARDTRVTSKLEGRATLIYLVREGTVVKTGDKVAELDASEIEERRANQAISVAKAEAALLQARKNFEIMERELQAAENTALSRLKIAELRREKLLGQPKQPNATDPGSAIGTNREMVAKLRGVITEEQQIDPDAQNKHGELVQKVLDLLGPSQNLDLAMGEIANQVLQQIDTISLTRADLKMAEDTLGHSERLAKKGYITRNELERDQINHQRQLSRMTVAWNDLALLVKYTLPESLITVEQEIENATLGLASVRGTGEARRVREAAELSASEAEFRLAKERLDNWNEQIANAVMRAPTPGLVVYARFDWDEPVYEGIEIRERQEIVILPDISKMVAQLRVHEAQIDRVAVGQHATIKVDAFPDRVYAGKVTRVSTLPEQTHRFQEQKLYGVSVELAGDNAQGLLRPGMSATVEIQVGVLTNVLSVPLAALERRGTHHYVWQSTPAGAQAVRVELGSNNLTHVEVTSGLADGDRIHLVRPPGARLPDGTPADAKPPADGPAGAAEASASSESDGSAVVPVPAATNGGNGGNGGGDSR